MPAVIWLKYFRRGVKHRSFNQYNKCKDLVVEYLSSLCDKEFVYIHNVFLVLSVPLTLYWFEILKLLSKSRYYKALQVQTIEDS